MLKYYWYYWYNNRMLKYYWYNPTNNELKFHLLLNRVPIHIR